MAIGRISGSVLKSNLTRNGVDLAFETNLLYLDVTNSRVGIGTSEPTSTLHVNGTITTTALSGLTSLAVDGVTITDNTVKSNASNSNLELGANGTGKVSISGLLFPTSDGSADQFLKTDGSGTLSFATVSTNSVSQGDSNVTVTDSGTGSITIDADGSTIITMNATTVLDASATTNAVRLPNGTTAQRPSGSVGMIRYNSSTDTIEGYTTAGGWAQLGATTATAENTDDTSTGDGSAISTTQGVIDQFVTSSFDSAWYLTVTRDEINDEVSTAKHSLVHNDTTAFVATSHITESDPTNAYLTAQADVAGGNARLLGTGGSVVNSVSFYRIAVGDNTTAGTTGNVTTAINLDVDSASEKIDGFALASARGAKYYISVNNTTTGELSNTEALVVHDGSNAYVSQYGTVNTGNNDLITLTAEIDSTEVILKASAQAPNCRVTVYRILLADDESASTGDNVNVVEATAVDSGATTVDSFATTAYTGAFYVFTGFNSTEGVASIQEVMVVANDEAYVTQGPIVNTKGTDQLTFTASLSGTTVTVQAASTSGASTIVNGYRVHMLRGSAGASTADTVLVSTEQTITGQKTFTAGILTDTIQSPGSNADITLDPQGTGRVVVQGELIANTISSDDSSAIQIEDSINLGSNTITANTGNFTNFTLSDTLTIGSQQFIAQGTNGFSVNEDFDPSNSATQTAYHFTSGAGRSELAFTLARTGQFTDGFGIYGTSADNTFVTFGETNNTSFEWRRGVGIQPLDLDGGTLLMELNSSGDLAVTGALSKGSGSFKIDHPLENKRDSHYLVHSFVEGPRADLIYRGRVQLQNGSATVNIDTVSGMTEGTFAALNDDVDVFVTNNTDWDRVKGVVTGNILTITCENIASSATISWLVIGDRKDPTIVASDWTDDAGKPILEPAK